MKYKAKAAFKFHDVDYVLSQAERSMVGDEQTGVCLACGAESGYVEPDAEGYPCEDCGERAVMSWEEVILRTAI